MLRRNNYLLRFKVKFYNFVNNVYTQEKEK